MKKNILLSIGRKENKQKLLPSIEEIPFSDFKLFATDKTSAFLNKKNIENKLLHKISNSDASPNIADFLIQNAFDLIINIPTRKSFSEEDPEYTDGRYIRQKAVENNTTLITDVEVATLYLDSLKDDFELEKPEEKRESPEAEPFTPYYTPLYDINKSYDFNYEFGPFFYGVYPDEVLEGQEYEILGFQVNSLFGVPAGPLVNSRWVNTYAKLGFDLLTRKTVRTKNKACHQPPNIVFIDQEKGYNYKPDEPAYSQTKEQQNGKQDYPNISITNSFGVPSKEPDVWMEDLKQLLPQLKKGQLLILSVMGTLTEETTEEEYIADYLQCAQYGVKAGANVIEVNLSCPNLGSGAVFNDQVLSQKIVKRVKQGIGDTPLLAKIGYFPNPQELETFVKKTHHYLDGYTAINTVPKKVLRVDGGQALPGKTRLRSGTCGAAIKEAGMSVVQQLDRIREDRQWDYEIIGVGGVMTPDDYFQYREAGADAVQAATGAMWNPYLAYQIKKAIAKREE